MGLPKPGLMLKLERFADGRRTHSTEEIVSSAMEVRPVLAEAIMAIQELEAIWKKWQSTPLPAKGLRKQAEHEAKILRSSLKDLADRVSDGK